MNTLLFISTVNICLPTESGRIRIFHDEIEILVKIGIMSNVK